MKTNFKTKKDFPPAYKANLALMEMKVNLDINFRRLAKKARKLAGIPLKGFKMSERDKYMINDVFLPSITLEQNGYLDEFEEIVTNMCSGFPTDINGNSHFRDSIKRYIYYNQITAPAYNFWMYKRINFEKGTVSYPTNLNYGYLYNFDKKEIDSWMKVLTSRLPEYQKKPLRGIKNFKDYKKIKNWDKNQKRIKDLPDNGTSNIDKQHLSTYKALAEEKYGLENITNKEKISKENKRIRKIKSDMKKHSIKRDFVF